MRLRFDRIRVVWVERIVIFLRLTGGAIAVLAISNVRAHVQNEHGVAEELPPHVFILIPMVLTVVMMEMASTLQHILLLL